jgi:hypothetical protein
MRDNCKRIGVAYKLHSGSSGSGGSVHTNESDWLTAMSDALTSDRLIGVSVT